MAYSDRQRFWIWLSSIPGLGPMRFDKLLAEVGSPERIYLNPDQAVQNIVGVSVYRALLASRTEEAWQRMLDILEREEAVAVTREDRDYPEALADAVAINPPPTLYIKGRITIPEKKTIAIVGSRNSTTYGTRQARRIARALSETGVTVVSGMARGTDTAAHRGAIDAKAATIAVWGAGIDICYPPENRTLLNEIIAHNGTIVTEYPPGTPPTPAHFPPRNRIIAALSEAMLLIEGTLKSGTQSTITYALKLDREIFALPGPVQHEQSQLPHQLIKDGAALITGPEDIARAMHWGTPFAPKTREAINLPLTQDEQRVYNLLSTGPIEMDEIVSVLSMPISDVLVIISNMELNSVLRQLPGRKVERMNPEED